MRKAFDKQSETCSPQFFWKVLWMLCSALLKALNLLQTSCCSHSSTSACSTISGGTSPFLRTASSAGQGRRHGHSADVQDLMPWRHPGHIQMADASHRSTFASPAAQPLLFLDLNATWCIVFLESLETFLDRLTVCVSEWPLVEVTSFLRDESQGYWLGTPCLRLLRDCQALS